MGKLNTKNIQSPFFSFIIPTKNRAKYLKNAITSCLNQRFSDFEIIISDNNSVDDTEEMVRSIDSNKIRYFNTGEDLSCTDNFEYCLTKAKGEYILYLADDEAYIPNALSKLKVLIDNTSAQVISFGRTSYTYPDVENNPNTLSIRPFTGNICWVSSSHALETLLSMRPFEQYYFSRALPLSVKSVIHRSIVEEIISKVGRYHLEPTPDWSSCSMILKVVEKVLLFDEHLNIAGLIPSSQGPKFKENRELEDIVKKAMQESLQICPLKSQTLYNCCVAAILIGLKNISKKEYEVFLPRYIALIKRELYRFKNNKIDTQKDFEELEELLKELSLKDDYVLNDKGTCLTNTRSAVISSLKGDDKGFKDIIDLTKNFEDYIYEIEIPDEAFKLYEIEYGLCEKVYIEHPLLYLNREN